MRDDVVGEDVENDVECSVGVEVEYTWQGEAGRKLE